MAGQRYVATMVAALVILVALPEPRFAVPLERRAGGRDRAALAARLRRVETGLRFSF